MITDEQAEYIHELEAFIIGIEKDLADSKSEVSKYVSDIVLYKQKLHNYKKEIGE